MILDINKKEINVGSEVIVHQEEGDRKSIVVELFPENPTVNKEGFWVDIDSGDGREGMMSYILEVV